MFFESFMYPASLTFRNHCHPAPLVTNASLPSLWSQCCAEAALLQRLLRTSSHFERFGNPVQQRYWSRVKEFVGCICQSLMNILRCPATQPLTSTRAIMWFCVFFFEETGGKGLFQCFFITLPSYIVHSLTFVLLSKQGKAALILSDTSSLNHPPKACALKALLRNPTLVSRVISFIPTENSLVCLKSECCSDSEISRLLGCGWAWVPWILPLNISTKGVYSHTQRTFLISSVGHWFVIRHPWPCTDMSVATDM